MPQADTDSDKPGVLLTYLKYMVVGAIVGVAAVIGRELVAYVLPAESPEYYALSVAVIYAIGILVSYTAHRKITFGHVNTGEQSASRSLTSFTAIALFGLVFTTGLSVVIRYWLPVEAIFDAYSGAVSFAAAAILSSIITFLLNARHTFRDKIENR